MVLDERDRCGDGRNIVPFRCTSEPEETNFTELMTRGHRFEPGVKQTAQPGEPPVKMPRFSPAGLHGISISLCVLANSGVRGIFVSGSAFSLFGINHQRLGKILMGPAGFSLRQPGQSAWC